MAAVPQRHDEQARLAILAGAFVERRGTLAIINLRFGRRGGFEAALGVRRIGNGDRADEAPYRLVGAGVPVVFDEVLVDGRGVAVTGVFSGDEGTMLFAGAASRWLAWHVAVGWV